MKSPYNLTGNVVEEIKKKHAFAWRLKDQIYAVYSNECKRVTEDSQLFFHYREYENSENGMNFDLVKSYASAYLSANAITSEETDAVFSELNSDSDDDLNSQLTNYVIAYSNVKGTPPPVGFGGAHNER